MGVAAGSNPEWERWGEVDPMFGVSAWEGRGVGEANPWTEEEFLALGERDWADFLQRWQRYGVTPGDCVEIGSGAGRMTRAMSGFFSHVHGLDVSAGMIAKAQQATEGRSVTFHQTDGLTFPIPDASVDAAFSTHVFQHFDSVSDAQTNFREIVRVLRPGGTLLVHIPMHFWPGGLERLQSVYAARRTLGDLRAKVQRRRMQHGGAPIMRGQSYRWDDVESFLEGLGCRDIELNLFRVSSNGSQHCCVLARKAG